MFALESGHGEDSMLLLEVKSSCLMVPISLFMSNQIPGIELLGGGDIGTIRNTNKFLIVVVE